MANLLLKRIKDWATSITSFRTGDVIPVDGLSGTAKMSKDDLLKETAQNALAGNVAPAFDPTRNYSVDESCTYEGMVYIFTSDHPAGAWNPAHATISGQDALLRLTGAYAGVSSELSRYVKELYIPAYEDSYIASVTKCGIYNDSGTYGIKFFDSNNVEKFAFTSSVKSCFVKSQFNNSSAIIDYGPDTFSQRIFNCSINVRFVRELDFNPSISAILKQNNLNKVIEEKTASLFVGNSELNGIIKELYLPNLTSEQAASIKKVLVQAGYGGNYGVVFMDENDSSVALVRQSSKSNYINAYSGAVVIDYKDLNTSAHYYPCVINEVAVKNLAFSPFISEKILENQVKNIFVGNPELNGIIKELYLPNLTSAQASSIKKVLVQAGYGGNYGVVFMDENDSSVALVRQSSKSNYINAYSGAVVIDYKDLNTSAHYYPCVINEAAVKNLAFSPFISEQILEKNLHPNGYFESALAIPSLSSLNKQRAVVYEGDTKTLSGYVQNAVSYPDGSFIVCRTNGDVAKVSADGSETILMHIDGASIWRLCYMDKNLNVYVSPHGSVNLNDRGLYRLEYGSNSFVKVISLYDPASSVVSETENNDDMIWTMCQDDDGALYAGVYAHTVRANPAVYKSVDGGESWVYKYNFKTSGVASSGKHIHCIIYNEYDRKLYAIVGEINDIYTSSDGASTWTAMKCPLEGYKGTALIATKNGLVAGSDGAYACILSKVYANGLVKSNGKMWANVVMAFRRSDVSDKIYAVTTIDSSVNVSNYYPPIESLSDTSYIESWLETNPAHKNDWLNYNSYASERYPDDAVRPQHCAILVSDDDGETWKILKEFYVGSNGSKGFITMSDFRNGECVCGLIGESGGTVRPLIITEGKHNYSAEGLELDGDIFVKINSSSVVVPL